jgi:hypothetical protein
VTTLETDTSGEPRNATAKPKANNGMRTTPMRYMRMGARTLMMRRPMAASPSGPSTIRVITRAGSSSPMRVLPMMNH